MSEENLKDQDLNSFHSLVMRLQDGGINDVLTAMQKKAVKEITDACCDRGGKHKATVKLKIDFVMDQKDGIVEIYATPDLDLPKPVYGRSAMAFPDKDGRLSRHNPRQREMFDEVGQKRAEREQA